MRPVVILAIIALLAGCATPPHRSNAARHAFARSHPCPATAQPSLPCPGWIIDHIEPLCSGGPDTPANMQWQTVADALKKDIDERRACRAAR